MIPCVAFSSLCALERSLNPLITITTKVQTKITSPKIEISNDDNAPFLSSFFLEFIPCLWSAISIPSILKIRHYTPHKFIKQRNGKCHFAMIWTVYHTFFNKFVSNRPKTRNVLSKNFRNIGTTVSLRS